MKISGTVGVAFIQAFVELFSFTKLKFIYKQNSGTDGLETEAFHEVSRWFEKVALSAATKGTCYCNYELTQSWLLSMEADDVLKSFQKAGFSFHYDGCTIVYVFRCTSTSSSSSHWLKSISTSSLHALNKTKPLWCCPTVSGSGKVIIAIGRFHLRESSPRRRRRRTRLPASFPMEASDMCRSLFCGGTLV